MVKKLCFLLLFILMVPLLSIAQTDSPLTLEGNGETPAIEHFQPSRGSDSDTPREQFTDPGAVVYHDGQFHMFRNAFVGWPAEVWIYHLVSEDGLTWEQSTETPILHTDDVPYADVAALASSVHVEDDGTWVLYFYTWNSMNNPSEGEIGRATASDPDGSWTVDETPVLSPGEAGDFDADGLVAPHVIVTDDGYMMYYDGFSGTSRSIGLATSDDGITWEKSSENPLVQAGADWEGSTVHQARVMQHDEGYLMVYRGAELVRGGMRLGVATSEDGITWERASDPILAPDMLDSFRAFWFTATALVDDTVYIFIELMPANNVTDIYTMTADITDLSALVGE